MTTVTWQMNKAMSELVTRHGVTLNAPQAVALAPASGPMLLSGLASTCDIDCERIQFAPFAFDPIPAEVPLRYNHTDQRAGYIEALAHDHHGALWISAYCDHPEAVRCNAFSVSGDVLEYTLHATSSPNFFARVLKVRLREVSLVPAPIQSRARVLQRSKPSPLSAYAASQREYLDLVTRGVQLMIQEVETIGKIIA